MGGGGGGGGASESRPARAPAEAEALFTLFRVVDDDLTSAPFSAPLPLPMGNVHSVPWAWHMRQTLARASTLQRDFLRRHCVQAGRRCDRYGRCFSASMAHTK